MGDRANVVIIERAKAKQAVVLYTHWSGTELPDILHTALTSPAGKGRWNDPSYLARIIFCEMVRGDEEGETGYGISTEIGDNEHPFLVVDVPRQVIVELDMSNDATVKDILKAAKTYPGIPFSEYTGVWNGDEKG